MLRELNENQIKAFSLATRRFELMKEMTIENRKV